VLAEIFAQNPTDAPLEKLIIHEVLVCEGDNVLIGQLLMIAEGTKAIFDIESHVNGIVSKVLVKPGDAVKVGQLILTIESA
jgi:pyruvate dehydrogenase E2 component (dihydrolipoamide acetyltransferase)